MTDEPLVKGSWPLVTMDGDRPLWHIAGTNPPQYAIDEKLEALWRASADLRESHENTMAPLKAPAFISFTIVKESGIIPSRKPKNGGNYGNDRGTVLGESQENQLVLDLDGG